MSKPQNMTKQEEEAWRKRETARKAKWKIDNREKYSKQEAAYRQRNKAKADLWRRNNKEKIAAANKKYNETLIPSVIAAHLRISVSECPSNLIEAKREIILTNRLIRNLGKTIKEQEND